MNDDPILAPLLQALSDLARWLEDERLEGVVIGGVAVALLGRPRVTKDVDAMILLQDRDEQDLLNSLIEHGFSPRLLDAVAFAKQRNVFLLRHQRSSIDVEIVLGLTPFDEEVITRSASPLVGGIRVPLPAPEDLIIMKAVAGRSHDLRDIEGIVAAHPQLDTPRILRWVGEYADLMQNPELLQKLTPLLPARK